jgi:aspartyl-tRNA(Asn)/glutamyl-tRNA(Gln) amidotransferase subunit B
MEINKIIIGLEVHIKLNTKSKMFCGCPADHFAKEPNTQTCPVCLGLPGALPFPNKKAIESVILFGLALGCEIPKYSRFDRKNYFYPDLPKGYQISQYQFPLAVNGSLKIKTKSSNIKNKRDKIIKIIRAHLEEDTAKLQHLVINGEEATLIDFNRSGVALMEVVSEPSLNSSEEAKDYLEKIQQLVRYLGIADADMEKGSMRCEPNVNLEIIDGDKTYYTPISELKNINSFRFAKKAIDYEVKRQFEEFKENKIEKSNGNKQTRGWSESKGITILQREKEEANDYRYFSEPDIPPIEWSNKQISNFKFQISNFETPWDREKRFIEQYNLSDYQARILTLDLPYSNYYEQCVFVGKKFQVEEVEIANILINKRAQENLTPEKLIDFILSTKTKATANEEDINKLIDKYLLENPSIVDSFKKGKIQALGLIVGLVKKEVGAIVSIQTISERIK